MSADRPPADERPDAPTVSRPPGEPANGGALPPAEPAHQDAPRGSLPSNAETLARAEDDPFATQGSAVREMEEFLADAAGHRPPAPTPIATVPGYEILAELGRGGMGVVYKARQLGLNRVVALKMVLAGSHAGRGELARFRVEAEAVARLQHPNIVAVHEVGEHEGRPFYSLEFCPGGSLDRKLNGQPLPPRQAAALVEPLARAVHAAHQKGVVHRDLKPGNVLLGDDGTPKVSDFGLAKLIDEQGGTRTEAVMGSPPYMAPEQATDAKRVGPATDVYALGAILYECLTGRPPFKAATALETLDWVRTREPVPVRTLNPGCPRDLETVTLKCLRKEPSNRYADAGDLADDLRRFLSGEPVRASPVGRLQRGWKWAKRRPGIAALWAAVVLLAAGGLGGVMWAYGKALDNERQASGKAGELEVALADVRTAEKKAREGEERAERRGEEAREKAEALGRKTAELERALANGKALLAQAAWDRNAVDLARELLSQVPEGERGWDWHYLRRRFEGGIFTLFGHTRDVLCVSFSPEGSRIATGSGDNTARVWDARTGQALLEFKGHTDSVRGVSFSPDGTRLATASEDNTARVWDARGDTPPVELRGHTGRVHAVSFGPDGSRLATACEDGTARVWDARSGQPLLTLPHADGVNDISFSPDGSRIATGSDDNTARVWDARTGEQVIKLTGHESDVLGVSFSPDGTRLATASPDGTARVWDVRTGTPILEILVLQGPINVVFGVSFSPDGTRLATSSSDGPPQVWDARTGRLLLTLQGHTGVFRSVAFSPDGARIATASDDDTARVWDSGTGLPLVQIKGLFYLVNGVSFSLDGRRLAVRSYGAEVWDACTGQLLVKIKEDSLEDVSLSPDGSRLATASRDGKARVWDAQTGRLLRELKVSRVDLFRGEPYPVDRVSFSQDGSRLATASGDKTVRVWDTQTGRQLLEIQGHDDIAAVSFSPDGARVAAAFYDGKARMWETRTGAPSVEFEGHGDLVSNVSFSVDGALLATASSDKTARVWDAHTGKLLLTIKGHTDRVNDVSFSPDGLRLATASTDRTARVWDAHTGQLLLTLAGHTGEVRGVSFSPDKSRLATVSVDGTLRLWDGRPLTDPANDPEELTYRLHVTRPDPDWHAAEADRFEKIGDAFATAFHLNRLAALRPWAAAPLHARRAARLIELGRPDQAAVAYLQAVLADPTLDPRSLPQPRPPAKATPAVAHPVEPIPPPRISP